MHGDDSNASNGGRGRQSLLSWQEQQAALGNDSSYRAGSDVTDSAQSHFENSSFLGYGGLNNVGLDSEHSERSRRPLSSWDEQQAQFERVGLYSAPPLMQRSRQPETSPDRSATDKIPPTVRMKDTGSLEEEDHPNTTTSFLLEWWKELAAIVISIAFLAAVCAVLLSIHDTQLANWSMPFDMQPTALIATLATLSRLFLLAAVAEAVSQLKWVYFEQSPHKLEDIEHFDSASRSAFGAVLFLGKLRWRAVVASVGALVTILALAMEPFAQQSLSFYDKAFHHVGVSASIPTTNAYDLHTPLRESPYNGYVTQLGSKFYAPMLGAMLEGLYNPYASIQHSCPAPNCTWPTFETLGICAVCEDVSSSVKTQCHQINDTSGVACQHELSDGTKFTFSCTQNIGGSMLTLWQSSTNTSVFLPDILSVSALWYPFSKEQVYGCGQGDGWKLVKPNATRCAFRWCAKTFNSNVTGGSLTETLVSSTDLIFPNKTCDTLLGSPVYSIDPDPLTMVYGAFSSEDDIPVDLCGKDWLQNNSAFWINAQDSSNIAGLLYNIFTQTHSTVVAPPLAEMLYSVNHRSLTRDVMAMADSMTNRIRLSQNESTGYGSYTL